LQERKPVAAHSVDPHRYRSYLLRLWREAPGSPWRCQICCAGTGRERRFATLAELFEFLVADAAGGEREMGRQAEGRRGESGSI
jgi:hypothetical protein